MGNEINMEKENFINQKKYELENKDSVIKENKSIFGIIKSIFEQSNKKSIENEFLDDFYKKYPQIEFEEYEDIEKMKEEFLAIFSYDDSCRSTLSSKFFYEIKQFKKVKIDGRNAYIFHKKYDESYDEDTMIRRNSLNLLMKVNLDDRLYVSTRENIIKKESFESNFIYKENEILEYDKNREKELREELSEDFYFSEFSINSDAKVFVLKESTKQKLLDIFNKHNIQFYVSIKDNLLRINVEIPNISLDSRYGILYELEKTFDELLKTFLELERIEDNLRYRSVEKEYVGIKNLIFDLDNTIILDTEVDSECFRDTLINAGYTDDYFYAIYQAINEYEKIKSEENPYYNEQEMLDFINEYLSQEFSINVIDGIKETIGTMWAKRKLVSKDTLEYLSSKYNLYIYTNYYQEVQCERIRNIGYEKYFKKIFGADKYGCKQFKKCFENVLNEINAKPEECVMIGDDKFKDILAANNVNMKSILFDYNGRRDKENCDVKNYFVIKNMNELKRIF